MTPAEQGRHCGSCNKTVIDFTALSDRELRAFFETASGRICGRLQHTQLGRELLPPASQRPVSSLYSRLFALLLTASVGTAYASCSDSPFRSSVQTTFNSAPGNSAPGNSAHADTIPSNGLNDVSTRVTLHGRLVSFDGKALKDVTVYLFDQQLQATTDSLGYFSLDAMQEKEGQEFKLTTSGSGLEPTDILLNAMATGKDFMIPPVVMRVTVGMVAYVPKEPVKVKPKKRKL